MTKITFTLATVAFAALVGSSAQALTITDLSTTAPTSSIEISSPTSDDNGGTATRSYYFVGQTFTTVSAFNLSSVTFLVNSGSGDLTAANWIFSITQLDGTILASENVSPGVNYASGTANHYLQFTLASPYALSAGTQYALGVNSSLQPNYVQFKQSATDEAYAGGHAYFYDGITVTPTKHDLTFYIESSPVPEPSRWALAPVLGTLAFLALRRFKSQASV